jgi:predicted nucleic acid-binding protein
VGTGEMRVVSDAGPLVHLAEIESLPLLSIFEGLHIPEAVWLETVGQERVSQTDVLGLGNVQRHTLSQTEVTRFIEKNNLAKLHVGERECLYLCRQIGVPVLLTDDLAVRVGQTTATDAGWVIGGRG